MQPLVAGNKYISMYILYVMNMCHQTENVNNLVIYKKKDMN